MRIVLFCFASVLTSMLYSQFGPGGVGSVVDNALWLDANVGTTGTNNNDPISSWLDQSGNGNHVSQTNPPQRPLLQESFMNGYPSILFDNNFSAGQNDFLVGGSSPTLDNTNGLTIFSVTRRNHLGNARNIVAKRDNVSVNQAYMFFYWTNDFVNVDIVSNDNRFTTSPFAFGTAVNRILNMRYDGTLPAASRASVFEGEQLLVTANESSATIPSYTSPLIIGATHVGDNRAFGGNISEIIIYRKAVNIANELL